jgi:uncharacterized protein (UPF0305 family)
MTKEEAEKLSILLMQISAQLDQSVSYVMEKDREKTIDSHLKKSLFVFLP